MEGIDLLGNIQQIVRDKRAKDGFLPLPAMQLINRLITAFLQSSPGVDRSRISSILEGMLLPVEMSIVFSGILAPPPRHRHPPARIAPPLLHPPARIAPPLLQFPYNPRLCPAPPVFVPRPLAVLLQRPMEPYPPVLVPRPPPPPVSVRMDKNRAGAKASTDPKNNLVANPAGAFFPRDVSSRTDVGDGAGDASPGLTKRWKAWAVEEEKKLVSVVETFGTDSWAKIAVNFPGRTENQCCRKWHYLCRKAASTNGGAWTVEEQNKLVNAVEMEEEKTLASGVETFGIISWDKIAANVPGRNESQCCSKWQYLSRKAAATSSGAWTVEEIKKLVSAVETCGTTSWVRIAANVAGRNEKQCYGKWNYLSKKSTTTAGGTWTAPEENLLVSAVKTFGTSCSWAEIAAKVPGRNESQCYQKWHRISIKGAATNRGKWTAEEEKKLVSSVETFGTTSWAKIATNVPGRNESQCWSKWRDMSRKDGATARGAWTVEEEKQLVSAIETFGTTSWAKIAAKVPGRSENQCISKRQSMARKAAITADGTCTIEEETKLASAEETYGGKWQLMSEQTAGAESVPKTDATALSQLPGLEIGPDLHVCPRETQKVLALLGMTTARSVLESNVAAKSA